MANNVKMMITFPAIRELGGKYRTLDGSKILMGNTTSYAKLISGEKSLAEQLTPEEVDYVIRQYILNNALKENILHQARKLMDVVEGKVESLR